MIDAADELHAAVAWAGYRSLGIGAAGVPLLPHLRGFVRALSPPIRRCHCSRWCGYVSSRRRGSGRSPCGNSSTYLRGRTLANDRRTVATEHCSCACFSAFFPALLSAMGLLNRLNLNYSGHSALEIVVEYAVVVGPLEGTSVARRATVVVTVLRPHVAAGIVRQAAA